MPLTFVITSPVTLMGFRSTGMWLSASAWHVTDESYSNNINYFALVLEASRGSCWQATCQHPKPTHFTAVGLSCSTVNLHSLLPEAWRQTVSLNTGKEQEMGIFISRSRICIWIKCVGFGKWMKLFLYLEWTLESSWEILSPNCGCQKFLLGTKAPSAVDEETGISTSSFVKTGIKAHHLEVPTFFY